MNFESQMEDFWIRLEFTNESISGFRLASLIVASLSTDCKCSSVRLDLMADLFTFMVEKNCSHAYVLPNIARIRRAKAHNLGNLSNGRNL